MRRVYLHVGIRSRIVLRGFEAGLFVASLGQYWIKQVGQVVFFV
jgi:hypothetical protein